MTKTVWILDIDETGAFDEAKCFARQNYNIVFTGTLSRKEAVAKIRKLLKISNGEIRFYHAEVANKENFELIKSYVIHNFGEYCLAKPIAKKT